VPSLAGNRFARRLRGVEQVERILDAPVLAQIPHLNVRSGGLQTVAGESERSRALRRLRDNVVVLAEATGARTLLVCGPSGRQGKGIVVAGLALGLAEADASVVAVEADSRRASLTQLLGVVAPPLGLAELLLGEIADEAAQMAVYSGAGAEFRLVSAGGARLPEGGLGSARMRELLASLAARHAHVLVSGPALLEQEDAVDLAALCDGVVLVVRNEQTTTREAEEARALLARVGAPVLGAVFTDTAVMRDRSARPAELRARVAAQPAAAGADAAAAG
jgi:Mrp family chromosome partitioning ATPase